MHKANERNSGIEFVLDDNNSYGDFASILNDLHITKHEIYGLDLEKTGHIFVLVNYKNYYIEEEPCLLCNDVIYDYIEPTFYENYLSHVKQLPNQAYYLIFGFLIFLNISMFSIKESLQNH